jgi:septation ring formation regulator EzrA
LAILIIIVLVVAICVLIVYNFQIQKKIEAFNNINERINNLSILQEFMKIAGQEESVEDKG